MRILITGANGFIGRHLANSFVEDGWNDVYCTERTWSSNINNKRPNLPHYFVDLTDLQELEMIMRQIQPDVIYHCAAHANVVDSFAKPSVDATTNILGTINLLEIAISTGVNKIIYSSSGGASYGEQQTKTPMTEKHPIDPLSPYGFSKWAAEQYFKMLDFPNFCVLRYSNVYGKNCRGVVKYFKDCYDKHESPVIYGTGDDTTRDYVHVSDVVSANRYVLKNDLQGTYNVSTGIPTTLNQLWETLVLASTSDPLTSHSTMPLIYKDLRDGECINNVLSSEKLQSEGWELKIGLIEGLSLDI